MERMKVDSSAAAAVGYDPDTQVLEVEFHGKNGAPGKVWQYFPVSQSVYDEMMAPGGSIGRTLGQKVKADPAITEVDVTDEQAVANA